MPITITFHADRSPEVRSESDNRCGMCAQFLDGLGNGVAGSHHVADAQTPAPASRPPCGSSVARACRCCMAAGPGSRRFANRTHRRGPPKRATASSVYAPDFSRRRSDRKQNWLGIALGGAFEMRLGRFRAPSFGELQATPFLRRPPARARLHERAARCHPGAECAPPDRRVTPIAGVTTSGS